MPQTASNNKQNGTDGWNLRNRLQMVVLVLTLAVGFHFFMYVLQAKSSGPMIISRPPGVEGFLPIGALLGWKHFLLSGQWDPIHPAAMVILGYAGLISLILRKSFCSWFCPVGTVSEWLWKLGRDIFGKNFQVPYWLDLIFRSIKYLLLGFFVWIIFSMSRAAIFAFLQSPYYKLSDVKMLHFFTQMSALSAAVLAVLLVLSVFLRNPWCRYLCPYGALMGLLALFGPTRLERNQKTCTNCKQCTRICPYHLPVHKKKRIVSPECSGCMDCTLVCPVENTLLLKTKWGFKKVWSCTGMALAVLALFLGLVYAAQITGHWKSAVSAHEFRARLAEIDSPRYVHP